jgi:hypothetical protein
MSGALAISAVTNVLQSMLNNVYLPLGTILGGSVQVSAVAPDIVQSSVGASSDAPPRVNLFLHQVTPNASWRNMGLPSLAADGSTNVKNPPLALDLHYLLTAYASADGKAEALLGYAILMLHEFPILSRTQIRSALSGIAGLNTSGLADQVEQLKITPTVMGREEMAWLWTALKADYRPSYPFQVSVVLIQPQNPLVSALPVLSRSITATPGISMLTTVAPPAGQPAASLGDTVTVGGENLGGASGVSFASSRLGSPQAVTTLSNPSATSFQFTVPDPPAPTGAPPVPTDLPAGVYLLSAQVTGAAGIVTTNGLPLAIAPKIISTTPQGTVTSGSGPVTIAVTCAPFIRPGQQVSLLIGTQEALASPFVPPTNSLSFVFANLQKTGGVAVPMRLRVDGIDSPITTMTTKGIVFSGPSIQVN